MSFPSIGRISEWTRCLFGLLEAMCLEIAWVTFKRAVSPRMPITRENAGGGKLAMKALLMPTDRTERQLRDSLFINSDLGLLSSLSLSPK